MYDKLSYKIRGAIYEVHKILGPGLFEECYHQALFHELKLRGLKVESKIKLPVIYKGIEIKDSYELDLIVEDSIIIELKSVEELSNKHYKQILNYLHLKKSVYWISCKFQLRLYARQSRYQKSTQQRGYG